MIKPPHHSAAFCQSVERIGNPLSLAALIIVEGRNGFVENRRQLLPVYKKCLCVKIKQVTLKV